MKLLKKFHIDGFLFAIIVAGIVGTILPAAGWGVDALKWLVNIFIFSLFFLFGVRLSPAETMAGLKNWRLHLTILSFTYILFPIIGLAVSAISASWLNPALVTGILYLTLIPSTVQSSVAFTSIAKGNVAAAVVAASSSNILGVFLTPALVWLLFNSEDFTITLSAIFDIVLQIFLPFALGQLSRRWTANWVNAHPRTKLVDQSSIILVVYSAFSAGMRENMWTQVSPVEILILLAICLIVLAFMLFFTGWVARLFSFNKPDAIAIQFCGTKKSLATGLPMAGVLFAGMPIGLVILPLVIFHQAQLMACAVLADHYAWTDEKK